MLRLPTGSIQAAKKAQKVSFEYGLKVGSMTIQGFSHIKKRNHFWWGLCACGLRKPYSASHIRIAIRTCANMSCGCQKRKSKVLRPKKGWHAWSAWQQMHASIKCVKNQRYKCHGMVGRKVVKHWHEFDNFYQDLGEPPTGMVLGLLDWTKDFSPSNCKWMTKSEMQKRMHQTRIKNDEHKTRKSPGAITTNEYLRF